MEDEIKLQENENKQAPYEIGYIVPFWSSKPLHKYSLDVWREGTIVDEIDITGKEFYVIGRNKIISDIYMNNMTVSRAHCIIQHKDTGEIFLYDLDSIYGTFINKNQIAKKTYIKLNVGDTFKIGQSGKMFILNGPADLLPDEEAIPVATADRRQIIDKRINQIKNQYTERESYRQGLVDHVRENVTWGQRDYDEEIMNFQDEEERKAARGENDDDDIYGITNLEEIKDRKSLTDKQRSMLEKIDALKKGIEKLKTEMLKIKKKEEDVGELTDGQKKRLDINEKKIAELNDKLELQEDNLRISLSSKDGLGGSESRFNKSYLKELNDSDDEYFDRSKITEGAKKATETKEVITENYETLKAKLEDLIKNRQRLVDKLQKVDAVKESGDEELDPLDAYFRETENKILSDDKVVITQQISEMSQEITKTQKLISLVTPSYIKIKYKSAEELEREKEQQQFKQPERRDELYDTKKKNVATISDTLQQFNKFKRKLAEQNYVDSDEQIIDEINNYKDTLTRELYDEEFTKRTEEFKKTLLKGKNDFDDNEVEEGGLIKPKNYFEEIVDNIGEEFNISKYSGIKSVMEKKAEKKQDAQIDYSIGGLQTFKKEETDVMLQRKRDRPENERQKIVYGPSVKPEDRNMDEIVDEEYDDFDPTTRFKRAHDISGNPYMKHRDD
jgi:hypothetical protein